MHDKWEKEGVFLNLKQMIMPKHTALIVVDMQNDFCSKGGVWDKLKRDISTTKEIIPKIAKLLSMAQKAGIQVIYLQNINLRDGKSSSPAEIARRKIFGVPADVTLDGSWGAEIIKELAPKRNEIIVKKHRSSGFIGTDLDLILRSLGIKSMVVCGVVSHGCVYATAWVGLFNNYYQVVVEDCIASHNQELHEAVVKLMKGHLHSVAPFQEILKIWS